MKYSFPKTNSNQEKQEYISSQLHKISKEKDCELLLPSVMKDQSFRNEIDKKIEERELKNEQNRGRGFGR